MMRALLCLLVPLVLLPVVAVPAFADTGAPALWSPIVGFCLLAVGIVLTQRRPKEMVTHVDS
jgi:hypothetical protein